MAATNNNPQQLGFGWSQPDPSRFSNARSQEASTLVIASQQPLRRAKIAVLVAMMMPTPTLLVPPMAVLAKSPAKQAASKTSEAKDETKPTVKPPNAQFYAQTASMGPTIHSGETVGLDTTAFAANDPMAGDIVVYSYTWSPTVQFAHRIIGVGGETVQVKDGVVILNGQPLAIKDEGIVKAGPKSLAQWRETLPNGRNYLVLHENAAAPENNTAVFTVPPGHFFVLADNRHNGSDSRRKDAGFLARTSIQGRLTMILRSNIDGREGAALE